MFIDLNDSTRIAEQLGSESYALVMRTCFRKLTELVSIYHFEIYQYVGDEAIITWSGNRKKSDVDAVNLFSDYQALLDEDGSFYSSGFGIKPIFKAAIHEGDVVQSEIGTNAKYFVYHGDVLNTTSRILGTCNELKTDLLISEEALNTYQSLPNEIFKTYVKISNSFFKNQIMTDSQFNE